LTVVFPIVAKKLVAIFKKLGGMEGFVAGDMLKATLKKIDEILVGVWGGLKGGQRLMKMEFA
jgi:hypothetical protein